MYRRLVRLSAGLRLAAALVLVAGTLAVVTDAAPAAAGPDCGSAHVASDFNGDGVADAAIGEGVAYIRVLYGTRAGLTVAASGSARANQVRPGVGRHPSTSTRPSLVGRLQR